MKRLLLTACLTIAAIAAAMAQKGLNINNLFDGRYTDNDRVAETFVEGGALTDYNVDLYHSLTLTDQPDQAAAIEALVKRDGVKATDREVSYRDGGLYYAFYELTPRNLIAKRYIFYLNQHRGSGNKIILIYIEGSASRDKIKKMLKQ